MPTGSLIKSADSLSIPHPMTHKIVGGYCETVAIQHHYLKKIKMGGIRVAETVGKDKSEALLRL
uniref:Uncharacterized protein n=1 Tax=Romanomermis culicivorax TaxID=13658 RepID=A0A915KLX2_ROMCU